MDIEYENVGDVVVATPRVTQLDNTNHEEFIEQINKLIEENSKTVLDLHELDFIDSSGLSSFAYILRRSRQVNARFCVCAPAEPIQGAFDLAHLDRAVDIYETKDEALGSFQPE